MFPKEIEKFVFNKTWKNLRTTSHSDLKVEAVPRLVDFIGLALLLTP
jgi:hypothetical protein